MVSIYGPNFFDLEHSWFVSDLHLNHYWKNKQGEERGVILFERTQFRTIQEHDTYIWRQLYNWAKNHPGHTLFILGDFGDTSQLWKLDKMRFEYDIYLVFVYGNHDSKEDYNKFYEYFDEVYLRPFYISNRVIISHEPIWPVPYGCVNVCGHVHGATLNSEQYLLCSIHTIGYSPFSWKKVSKQLSLVPKVSYKFLQEPYAHLYHFLQPRPELVLDKNNNILLEESRKKKGI